MLMFVFFFFKQKTAYEMRISDWSSDVCSSDLVRRPAGGRSSPVLRRSSSRLRPPSRPAVRYGCRSARSRRERPAASRRRNLRSAFLQLPLDRKSVVEGKGVAVRVDLGGRRIIKKKTQRKKRIDKQIYRE